MNVVILTGRLTADVELLSALSDGECKGIKGATAYKITQFATEKGLI